MPRLAGLARLSAIACSVGAIIGCGGIEEAGDPAEIAAKGDWSYSTSRICPRDGDSSTDLTSLPVQGFDVSSHQRSVDWDKVRETGKTFAIARLSNGLTRDPLFVDHYRGLGRAGLVRGAYQFLQPTQDARAQAELFLSALAEAGGIGPQDLPPIVDIEIHTAPADVVQRKLKLWLDVVGEATGTLPIVYTMAGMSSLLGTGFSAHRLWVANFYQTCPRTPEGWAQWDFHQYTDVGSVDGIPGPVDLDVFNGSHEEFDELIALRGHRPAAVAETPAAY